MKPIHTLVVALILGATVAPAKAEDGWLSTAKKEAVSKPVAPPVGPLAGSYGDPKGLDLFAGIPLEPDPPTARRFFEEGRRLGRMGQPRLAVNRFRSAYKRGLDRLDLDYYLGSVLLDLDKPRHALFHTDTAMALGGEDAHLLTVAGRAFQALGQHSKAMAHLERALQLDPASGEAHFRLALAYDEVDNSPKVLEHAQKAIRIDPAYKAKLKPAIKDSGVSRKVGRIVDRVLKDSKYERLSDEKIEAYSEEIGHILGEEN